MTRLLRSLLLYSLLSLCLTAHSQVQGPEDRREVIKFGLGVKTIMTSDLLSVGETQMTKEGVDFTYAPKFSLGIDAIIRLKLKGRFSLQTGLSSIRRDYDFGIASDTLSYSGFIRNAGFQIPITGLLQVPISDKAKMGIEVGYVQDALPTNVSSGTDSFLTYIYVINRFRPALRTSAVFSQGFNNGSSFEVGFTYHRMLGRLGTIIMDYDPGEVRVTNKSDLSGHFFSFNLAFFFP